MKAGFYRFFNQIVNYYGLFFRFLKPMITVFLRNFGGFFFRENGEWWGWGLGDGKWRGGRGWYSVKGGICFFSFNFRPIIKYLFDFLPKKTYISQKHELSAWKVEYVLNHMAWFDRLFFLKSRFIIEYFFYC